MNSSIDKNLKKITIKPENINITAEQAVRIANTNKCLKDSFFKEQVKKNMKYGYIGFTKFGVKRVIYEEVTAIDEKGRELYHEREAWYVKVLEGEWGATKYEEDCNTGEKRAIEDWDGYFTSKDNICCLIFVDNGEYLYLTEDLLPYIYNKKENVESKKKVKQDNFNGVSWLKGK